MAWKIKHELYIVLFLYLIFVIAKKVFSNVPVMFAAVQLENLVVWLANGDTQVPQYTQSQI
jgi:hypothetical protein